MHTSPTPVRRVAKQVTTLIDAAARRPGETIAVAVVAFIMVTAGVWGSTSPLTEAASASEPVAGAATPTPTRSIVGVAAIDADAMKRSWHSTGNGQPARLGIGIDELIDVYYAEAAAEGVRADWAFVQAIHETGWFTSHGTAYNNFSGIAHCDTCVGGLPYDHAVVGVRAQIQLLRRVAEGNDITHTHPVAAPQWLGHHVGRWDELGGNGRWATDPDYWPKLAAIYTQLGGEVPAG